MVGVFVAFLLVFGYLVSAAHICCSNCCGKYTMSCNWVMPHKDATIKAAARSKTTELLSNGRLLRLLKLQSELVVSGVRRAARDVQQS